jgi:uncharacterized protein (UPF0248 family)
MNQGKNSRKKKGSLEETISFAQYKDNPEDYLVYYRDKDKVKAVNLNDFVNSEEFSDIPVTRIIQISTKDRIVWTKGQKEVLVKS